MCEKNVCGSGFPRRTDTPGGLMHPAVLKEPNILNLLDTITQLACIT